MFADLIKLEYPFQLMDKRNLVGLEIFQLKLGLMIDYVELISMVIDYSYVVGLILEIIDLVNLDEQMLEIIEPR